MPEYRDQGDEELFGFSPHLGIIDKFPAVLGEFFGELGELFGVGRKSSAEMTWETVLAALIFSGQDMMPATRNPAPVELRSSPRITMMLGLFAPASETKVKRRARILIVEARYHFSSNRKPPENFLRVIQCGCGCNHSRDSDSGSAAT